MFVATDLSAAMSIRQAGAQQENQVRLQQHFSHWPSLKKILQIYTKCVADDCFRVVIDHFGNEHHLYGI
jgi:hypothetical protein